jgi:hypothetical protein
MRNRIWSIGAPVVERQLVKGGAARALVIGWAETMQTGRIAPQTLAHCGVVSLGAVRRRHFGCRVGRVELFRTYRIAVRGKQVLGLLANTCVHIRIDNVIANIF